MHHNHHIAHVHLLTTNDEQISTLHKLCRGSGIVGVVNNL